ncbi:MAG: hypothetical protein NT061_04760 [Spirochaetes bacterium]|nr:hypothetical protein [Spirochaetota bacterium]
MTDYETLIAQLDAEFEALQFTRLGFEEAWQIGQDLAAIDKSKKGQTLFHAVLPGSVQSLFIR